MNCLSLTGLSIPEQLEKAIQRKIRKGHARKCVLLIYLNMSNYGVLQKETEATIAKIKARYATDFHESCTKPAAPATCLPKIVTTISSVTRPSP